jgi:hypothetical protein
MIKTWKCDESLITSAAVAELCSEKETINARGKFNISSETINIEFNGGLDETCLDYEIREVGNLYYPIQG